jgi:hypothetical protein
MDIHKKRQRAREIYERLQREARGPEWVESSQPLTCTSEAAVYTLAEYDKPLRSVVGFDKLLALELGADTSLGAEGIKWKPLKSATIYHYLSSPGTSHVFTLSDGARIQVTRIR